LALCHPEGNTPTPRPNRRTPAPLQRGGHVPDQTETESLDEARPPPAACINLKERYGHRYRIAWDPADESGHRHPWMMTMSCRRGTIYPYGGNLLAVDVDGHPITARRLAELGLRCTQDGDAEKTFVFPLERFEEVAALVLPRKRRSSETADRLRSFRFTPTGQSLAP
jgi:hypothetical protein